MTIFEKIKKILDEAEVKYSVIEHEPVYTSVQAGRIRDVDISQGAKSLILIADERPILAVVPGDKKVDFKTLKRSFGIKDLRMASPDEVVKITTLEIGAIPPIGRAMGIDSYYDQSFLEKDDVVFNAGSHTISIFMKACDLLALERPEISEIALNVK